MEHQLEAVYLWYVDFSTSMGLLAQSDNQKRVSRSTKQRNRKVRCSPAVLDLSFGQLPVDVDALAIIFTVPD